MPKLKTHKGAAARFHKTGSGKIMQTKGGKSHFRRRKSARAKRLYDETTPLNKTNERRMRKLLPYG